MEMTQTPPEEKSAASSAWLGYVAPMAVFLILTFLEGQFPKSWYVGVYAAKAVLVTGTLIAFRSVWRDIRFEARVLLPALFVGLLVFAEWVLLDPHTPQLSFLGKRAEFNPFAAIPDPMQRGLFLFVRFYGLALMVPVMEELFWRSFLLRYITAPDFEKLPMGTYSWGAFAAVAVLFGAAHPEWLVAILCACAYALLLRQTKSLFACIVAHATTNLALGIYVLLTQQWRYW